jgi:GT2 family glycosyltransferase
MTRPDVSIIIPTHNRRASAARALQALSVQCCPGIAVEVILVADGCTDDTASVAAVEWPVFVRVLEQPRAGAAAARNRGAAAAAGHLLIFVDDDVEVLPGFLAAHVEAHAATDRVVIGYLPPQLQGRRDLFAVMLRAWWEAMFERMRDPGHRFAYSDLLTGNFSLPRSLFERVGGFDETLHCHEDYELGYRLIAAGARFQFAPAAAGWHHECTDLARSLRRKRDEGRADVALAHRHPGLTPTLPLARPHTHLTRRGRVLRHLAVAYPTRGGIAEAVCRQMLSGLEALRLRIRWRLLLNDLLSYWYMRGVAEALNGKLGELPRAPKAMPVLHPLDLRPGLAHASAEIDSVRPEGLSLRWGSLVIGTVPPQPGAEPLQGRHLRSLLRTRFAAAFRGALALAYGERLPASRDSAALHELTRLNDAR